MNKPESDLKEPSACLFWVYGPWATHATKNEVYECWVTPNRIQIGGPEPDVVLLSDVVSADVGRMGFGMSSIWYVSLQLSGNSDHKQLWPVNPLAHGVKRVVTRWEAEAMKTVIEEMKKGEGLSLDRNPYVRQATIDRKPEKARDKEMRVSPAIYAMKERPGLIKVVGGLMAVTLFLLFTIWIVGLLVTR